VPRQFISLGTAPDVGADSAPPPPVNNNLVGSAVPQLMDHCPAGTGTAGVMPLPTFDHHHRFHESGSSPEEAPQHVPQGWLPNPNKQVPKFLAAKAPEPAPEAATMRKARVSVRARSEAPMVTNYYYYLTMK
jgi:hypothetical protein